MLSLIAALVIGAGITYPPLTVQEEGANLVVEPKLNFIGTSITCVDDAANGRTNCTVTSGGGASPLTTKGDIYTYSTVDDRKPVGTDGQCLIADSTQATGLKWDTCAAGGSGLTFGEVQRLVFMGQ